MEEIFKLIEEEKIQLSIESIQDKLKEGSEAFIEDLINNIARLFSLSDVVLKSIFPNVIKLIGIENDVLRYSLHLALKPLCESNPEIIVSFSKECLTAENPNTREGILQLLTFSAKSNADIIKPLLNDIIPLLSDEQEFIQNKTIDFLKVLGRNYALEVEKQILEYLSSTTNTVIRDNAEIVLKELVNIKKLESDALEKKQVEVQKKILDSEEDEVSKEENKAKEEELETRKEMLNIKKESKEKKVELTNKEKELMEKELALKEKELHLKEADLLVKEKEKEIEEEIIRQRAEVLEKDIEITRKKAELELVKKELEIKEIEKEKEEIIKKEQDRLKQAMDEEKSNETDNEEDYEDMNLD